MDTTTTITSLASTRHPTRTALVGFALILTILAATFASVTREAEAATLAHAPSAVCGSVNGSYGFIRVSPGLVASGRAVERAALAYRIERWNGRSWVEHATYSYFTMLYPVGTQTVELMPVHHVHHGYHRVVLALSWNENGVTRNWGGVVKYYFSGGRLVSNSGWCAA